MDYLKDGIGLRAMAQRDPLIEYQREGYQMFQAMMGQIKEESVGYLYNLEVEVRRAGPRASSRRRSRPRAWRPRRSKASAPVLRGERRRRGRGAQRARSGAAGGDQPPAPGRRAPRRRGRAAAAPRAEAPRARRVRPADGCAGRPAAAAPQNRAQRRAAEKKK